MIYRKRILATVVILWLAVLGAEAAENSGPLDPYGEIQGKVVGERGSPVAEATVQLLNDRGVIVREVSTTGEGTFLLAGFPAGSYRVQARTAERVSAAVAVEAEAGQKTEVRLRFGQELAPEAAGMTGPEAAAGSDVVALRGEMEDLKRRMAALQEQLQRLNGARDAGGSPVEVPPVADVEASASATSALTGSRSPNAAAVLQESSEQEKPLPGQGETDKGLYHGLAAGAPGQRYARGIFGDKVKIGGYGSFRFEANNIDLGPQINNLPRVRRGFNSFDFRRFVLTLDATPVERLRVYTEIEFERLNEIEIERTAIPENRGSRNRAGTRFIQEVEGQSSGEIAVEQAWAQYDFSPWLGLRMGVILPPVGRFNILHDDDYWDIPRRTLVDRGGPVLPVKSAWRELGAGVLGNIPLGRGYLDYQFYVVNGVRLDFVLEEVVSLREGRNLVELEPEIAFFSGPFDGTDTADAVTWRVALSPRLGSEIAFSGYHGQYTPDFLNIDSSINSVAVDGKLTLNGFEVEGEFVYTDFGRMEAVLGEIARQAVDAAAKTSSSETATLETEVEGEFAGPFTNQRYGFWVDLKYRFWPRFLENSFLGRDFENPQLIPIVRFERIWFNDFVKVLDFAGGVITDLETENLQQQRTTLGLTYRPTPSVAFTSAWEHNQRIAGSRLIFPGVVGLGRLPDNSFDTFILGVAFGF
ncbi:MAG: carboxypeptidase regulatory-like domain-containing protein [Terriglobia bacterium]